MADKDLLDAFAKLPTPVICDACVRLGVSVRLAPAAVQPLNPEVRVAGRVLPVRHYGSVDIFLKAMGNAQSGDVLVIDNGGRMDEACIGDLVVLEAQFWGLGGIVVWGAHRDTGELMEIGFPVFSSGRCAVGPRRLEREGPDAFGPIQFGAFEVDSGDIVLGDCDGVLFVSAGEAPRILPEAVSIQRAERAQADAVLSGKSLREQLRFDDFLARQATDPVYTFREHLRQTGGAIET